LHLPQASSLAAISNRLKTVASEGIENNTLQNFSKKVKNYTKAFLT
jgi:hypothetical protein